jgi:hypothetical protein
MNHLMSAELKIFHVRSFQNFFFIADNPVCFYGLHKLDPRLK